MSDHEFVGLANCLQDGTELQAAIAMARQDDSPEGMMNDFEAVAAYIIPRDPVVKRKTTSRKYSADVSTATTEASPKKRKSGTGLTGVELRFHTTDEYSKLTKDQKAELYQWRQTAEGKEAIKNEPKRQKQEAQQKKIAAAVAKALKK